MLDGLKKEPIPQMDIASSLAKKLKQQQEEDLKEFELR